MAIRFLLNSGRVVIGSMPGLKALTAQRRHRQWPPGRPPAGGGSSGNGPAHCLIWAGSGDELPRSFTAPWSIGLAFTNGLLLQTLPKWSWLDDRGDVVSDSPCAIDGNTFETEANSPYTINRLGRTYRVWLLEGLSDPTTNSDGTQVAQVYDSECYRILHFTDPASGLGTVGHGLGIAPKVALLSGMTDPSVSAYSPMIVTGSLIGDNAHLDFSYNFNIEENDPDTVRGVDASVIKLGTWYEYNQNNTGVPQPRMALIFKDVPGKSAVGTYVGTGSDEGLELDFGFEPAFVLVKALRGGLFETSYKDAGMWTMLDHAQPPGETEGYIFYQRVRLAPAVYYAMTATGVRVMRGPHLIWDYDLGEEVMGYSPDLDLNNEGAEYLYIAFAGTASFYLA